MLPEPVRRIWEALDEESPTYLVGGAVRDLMMHSVPHDYDFASARRPEQVQKWAREAGWQCIPTGIRFGTVTLVHPSYADWPVELTTFRRDGRYTDGRHPSEVRFSEKIEDDLSRRDFSMNAMALTLAGQLVDPFHGQEDIQAGQISTVGAPSRRFAEDPLRMWRAVRFIGRDHAGSPLHLSASTASAITALLPSLLLVSGERQRDELLKLLATPHFSAALEIADQVGILGVVWPEWTATRGFEQHNSHHNRPVHAHLLATAAEGRDPLLRLAGLLHDIGKPECFTLDSEGHGHFYGHEDVGAVYVSDMLRRLKFDSATVRQVRDLVAHHMFPWEKAGDKALRKATREWGADHIGQLWELRRMDIIGSGTASNWERQEEVRQHWESAQVLPTAVGSANGFKLAADGKQVMLWAQIPPGPEVGHWLHRVQDWVDEDPRRNTAPQIRAFIEQDGHRNRAVQNKEGTHENS